MTVRFDPTKEVPSLELCERLKKIGFPQDGEGWCWRKEAGGKFLGVLIDKSDLGWTLLEYVDGFWVQSPYLCWKELKKLIKAPTVRELGEWLPISIKEGKSFLDIDRPSPNTWIVGYTESHSWRVNAVAYDGDTEANARAKMIIWLVENGYVKFKEEKQIGVA